MTKRLFIEPPMTEAEAAARVTPASGPPRRSFCANAVAGNS